MPELHTTSLSDGLKQARLMLYLCAGLLLFSTGGYAALYSFAKMTSEQRINNPLFEIQRLSQNIKKHSKQLTSDSTLFYEDFQQQFALAAAQTDSRGRLLKLLKTEIYIESDIQDFSHHCQQGAQAMAALVGGDEWGYYRSRQMRRFIDNSRARQVDFRVVGRDLKRAMKAAPDIPTATDDVTETSEQASDTIELPDPTN